MKTKSGTFVPWKELGIVMAICAASGAEALTVTSGPSFSPTANAPLAGVLALTTDANSQVSVSVSDGTGTWERDFFDYGTNHSLALLGFKPNRTNEITVTVRDQYRNTYAAAEPVSFVTGPLPADMPTLTVLTNNPAQMEPGYTLFRVANATTGAAYVTIVDNSGEVVWYGEASGERGVPGPFPTPTDVTQLTNGDLFFPEIDQSGFAEVDMLGRTVRTWNAPYPVDSHEDLLTDHGTILYLNYIKQVITNFPSRERLLGSYLNNIHLRLDVGDRGWQVWLMARPPRLERPGAWHHVTARGNERRAIYRDDRDRQHFCQLLGQTVETFGWRLHAYVLMDNHFHLLVETPEPNLGRGMQWLNVSYSVWFNRRHQRSGHLFQGRFKGIVVDPAGWALELSRYIHLNPVRTGALGLGKSQRQTDRTNASQRPDAGRVRERVARLRGYRWSSYQAYAGFSEPARWLHCARILELGGARKGKSERDLYRRHVEAAVRQGLKESPWEKLRGQTILGGAAFARRLARGLGGRKSQAGWWREACGRPTVSEIIAAVEKVKGEPWATFRDRHGDWGRDAVFHIGRTDWGIKLRELGERAGGISELTVSMAAKRMSRRLEVDSVLAADVWRCRGELSKIHV